jgi:hypothetical protein
MEGTSNRVAGLVADAEWQGTKAVSFQIDGNDLVSVIDIDRETGDAEIVVWESTASDAAVAWRGRVNLLAHQDGEEIEGDED